MNEKIIFDQFEFARNITLLLSKEITEDNADDIPNGFPNSLRWQLGHIYVSVEMIVFHNTDESVNIPQYYAAMFSRGTRPSEWNTTPPRIEEILILLFEQLNRVKKAFSGRMEENLSQPVIVGPLTLETIGDILSFASFHESEHIGVTKSLLNALVRKSPTPKLAI